MPLYDYRCKAGHLTEALRRFVDREAPMACGRCPAEARYDGMPAPNVGTHRPFAVHLEDGRRVVSTMHTAPKKRPVTSKG